MEQYVDTVKRNDKIGGNTDILKLIAGPTNKDAYNKIEDKIDVYVLDNLKRTHQNRIENNEKITAPKSFGDSTVKVVVDPAPFSVDQSKSSTSGSATNDTQRTFSSLNTERNKNMCDANSKSILTFIAGPTNKDVSTKIEDKETNVYELDNLKRTHQNRIENNEKITAPKSFGDSTVKVVVDPAPFSVDQSKSSTSGSATNDTQRTFSSLIPKPNKTTCDANSKYSRNNKTATSSTLPPMTLTANTMTGDNKAYAIVASSPSNCGQSLPSTFRGNREYKEEKEDDWLKQKK